MSVAGLRAALLDRGGELGEAAAGARADAAAAPPHGEPLGPAALAAAGPRAAGRRAAYELLVEMIVEGSLLHYGRPRVVACEDPDLALLLGDQLYALGLSELAQLGDLDAVAELADVISLLAQARVAGDATLVGAIWAAGAAAIGWGTDSAHARAKALARAGDPGAPAALITFRDATAGSADGPGT